MRALSFKPVGKCYTCRLNLGDHCWLYRYPRGQWRKGRNCPAFDNAAVYAVFDQWRKQPSVKNRKELRKEVFRTPGPCASRRDPVSAPERRERTRLAGGC